MKNFFFACLALLLTAIFTLTTFGGYHNYQGENVEVYSRFFSADSTGNKSFNLLGLLSPLQVETQKVVTDTMRFTHKVVYPYGKNFQCIAPDDTTAEEFVAQQIAKAINDSLDKVSFNTRLDYDRTAMAVREAANPNTRILAKPTVKLQLLGTASPEARKYGFEQSVMPGAFETENEILAQSRMDRTIQLLIYHLRDIDSLAIEGYATELQFSDTASAMMAIQNTAILDSLRWVEADVTISIERLEITPATAPILFPFWLWTLVFGLLYFWHLRLPKIQRPKLYWGGWSWGGPLYFLKILAYCILASILLTALIAFVDWRLVFFLMMLALLFTLAYLAIRYADEISDAVMKFFSWIAQLVASIALLIWKVLLFIWGVLVSVWKWLKKIYRYLRMRWAVCWSALPPCWRRVVIALTLYAMFATYKWLTCPC